MVLRPLRSFPLRDNFFLVTVTCLSFSPRITLFCFYIRGLPETDLVGRVTLENEKWYEFSGSTLKKRTIFNKNSILICQSGEQKGERSRYGGEKMYSPRSLLLLIPSVYRVCSLDLNVQTLEKPDSGPSIEVQ